MTIKEEAIQRREKFVAEIRRELEKREIDKEIIQNAKSFICELQDCHPAERKFSGVMKSVYDEYSELIIISLQESSFQAHAGNLCEFDPKEIADISKIVTNKTPKNIRRATEVIIQRILFDQGIRCTDNNGMFEWKLDLEEES